MYKSIEQPGSEDRIIPTIRKYIKDILEHLDKKKGTQVDADEVIGMLHTMESLTHHTGSGIDGMDAGFYHMPYPPSSTTPIMSRYAKKMAEIEKEPEPYPPSVETEMKKHAAKMDDPEGWVEQVIKDKQIGLDMQIFEFLKKSVKITVQNDGNNRRVIAAVTNPKTKEDVVIFHIFI